MNQPLSGSECVGSVFLVANGGIWDSDVSLLMQFWMKVCECVCVSE